MEPSSPHRTMELLGLIEEILMKEVLHQTLSLESLSLNNSPLKQTPPKYTTKSKTQLLLNINIFTISTVKISGDYLTITSDLS